MDEANDIQLISAGLIQAFAEESLIALLNDQDGSPSPARDLMLGTSVSADSPNEIGVGQAFSENSTHENYWAIQIAAQENKRQFLTGVVFEDANENGTYEPGEGLDGVSVTTGETEAFTSPNGAYALPVDTGTHTVRVSGGAFAGEAVGTVDVGSDNVELDFTSGNNRPDVNFADYVNRLPVANDDSVSVLGQPTYEIVVVANDSDLDGVVNPATVQIIGTPEHGAAIVDSSTGAVYFTPTPGFLGTASFQYQVSDNEGLVSNVANSVVNILPTSQWTNPVDRYDVDDSDNVSPGDALTIINVIADGGFRDLPSERPEDTYFLDVTNDNRLTPADALAVIDFIAARQAARIELISSDFLPERPESASDESPDAIVDENVLFAGRRVVKNSGDGRFVNAVSLPEIHSGLDLAPKDVVDDALSGLLDQHATLAADIQSGVGD